MKSAHRLPTQRQPAIFEIPTEDVYTGCLYNKAAEESSWLVPQSLLVGLNGQIWRVTSPIIPASFTRGCLTTASVTTCWLTQRIRTTFLMKIHPYLFYSKQVLCLQLPTTNPATHIYGRERNCTISPTFARYLENTILKDLALKDKNLLPPNAPQPGEERHCIPN